MTAAVVSHPRAAEAAQRIRDREIDEHAERMHWLAVERAIRIIDRPGSISDAKLATACLWYMRLSKAEGGGGGHYLRADQHLTAIRQREAEARDAQETSIKIAMRYTVDLRQIAIGAAAALIVAAGFHWLVMP